MLTTEESWKRQVFLESQRLERVRQEARQTLAALECARAWGETMRAMRGDRGNREAIQDRVFGQIMSEVREVRHGV